MCEFKTKFLSTRDAAKLLNVSESSIKRWVDQGSLKARKTSGGHRKIDHADLFDFVQDRNNKKSYFDFQDDEININDFISQYKTAMEEGDLLKLSDLATHQMIRRKTLANFIDETIYPAYLWLRSECHHPSDQCRTLHRAISHVNKILEFCTSNFSLHSGNKSLKIVFADVGYDVDGLPTYFAEYVAQKSATCIQLGLTPPLAVLSGAMREEKPDFIWVSANGDKVSGFNKSVALIHELSQEHNVKVLKYGKLLQNKLPSAVEVKSFRDLDTLISQASQ